MMVPHVIGKEEVTMATAPRRIPDSGVEGEGRVSQRNEPLEQQPQEQEAPPPQELQRGVQAAPELAAGETASQDVLPTEEDIRLEAYLIYRSRGHEGGSELADWFEAERRLRGDVRAKV
jgi:Protein of unknown function (DUF2934)